MVARTGSKLKLLLLLSLAGCSHGGSATSTTTPTTAKAAPAPEAEAPDSKDDSGNYPPGTHKASPAAVRVITRWSEELRAGHVRKAATYFDVPALVQNASPLVRLKSKQDVYDFNNMLPCGAHVVKTLAGSSYTVATFVLTERPGSPGCGATGKLAATAFRLHDGKISEWRRVLVPPPLGPAQNLKQGEPVA